MALKGKNRAYVKIAQHEAIKGDVKKTVMLYSGSFDNSVMLKWIQEVYRAEVVALIVDLGQRGDLEKLRQQAMQLGAVKAVVVDAKQEFIDEYVAKAIKANAAYQGRYYLSTALGRPLLAKWAIKIAAREGADSITHGSSDRGNDHIRIEGSALALNPDIKVIAPAREWEMNAADQLRYAKTHKISVKPATGPYYYDENLWGVTAEGGEVEDPTLIPPLNKILLLCAPPEKAKNAPEYVTLEFVKGLPVAIDERPTPLIEIISELNKRAAKHAVGITHLLEDQIVGLKVRGLYEAPAAETIITAHKALERYTSTRRENEFKSTVDEKWSYLCYGGLWYEPLMEDLNAYEDKVNDKITGTVTVKLFKGHVEAVAVETPNTVFDEKLATYMQSDTVFNPNASAGFIEQYTYQMKLAQRRQRTALLAVGGRQQKLKLLPEMRKLDAMGYRLYGTYKTYKFLRSHGVEAILVNKISNPELKPNLSDLLDAKRFDLIINIPMAKDFGGVKIKEKTDGQAIREKAVRTSTPLITSVAVAKDVVTKLTKARI